MLIFNILSGSFCTTWGGCEMKLVAQTETDADIPLVFIVGVTSSSVTRNIFSSVLLHQLPQKNAHDIDRQASTFFHVLAHTPNQQHAMMATKQADMVVMMVLMGMINVLVST